MKDAKVKDIMSKEVQTLERNDTLNLAQGLMGQKRIRHFPVLGGDVLVGVVSQRDLFHATLGSVMNYGERSEEAYLATVAVKEVMQEPAIIVSPQVSVQEAAGLMVEKQSWLPSWGRRGKAGWNCHRDRHPEASRRHVALRQGVPSRNPWHRTKGSPIEFMLQYRFATPEPLKTRPAADRPASMPQVSSQARTRASEDKSPLPPVLCLRNMGE